MIRADPRESHRETANIRKLAGFTPVMNIRLNEANRTVCLAKGSALHDRADVYYYITHTHIIQRQTERECVELIYNVN